MHESWRHELIKKYQGPGRKAFRFFREENQKLREDTKKQLEAILTVAQMKEYKAPQEELREKVRQEFTDLTSPPASLLRGEGSVSPFQGSFFHCEAVGECSLGFHPQG